MKFIFALTLCCTQLGFAKDSDLNRISIVTLDKNGSEKVVTLSRDKYIKINTKVINLVQRIQLPKFERIPLNWELTQIRVGLGLDGEVGIGPYQVGFGIKQRFVFTKGSRK